MTDDVKKLWERQSHDTDKAFRAFTIYLTMTPRSLQAAADAYYGKAGASRGQLEKWSSRHDWQARVRAYDDHVAALERQDYEKRRLEARRKRQNTVENLHGLLSKVMHEQFDSLSPVNISQIASAATRILDQSRQEFDDLPRHRTEHSGVDGGKIEIRITYDDDDSTDFA